MLHYYCLDGKPIYRLFETKSRIKEKKACLDKSRDTPRKNKSRDAKAETPTTKSKSRDKSRDTHRDKSRDTHDSQVEKTNVDTQDLPKKIHLYTASFIPE